MHGGKDVVLIGISTDSPEELNSWASDEDFPFLFASDPNGEAYSGFGGALRSNDMPSARTVIVVDPEGRVAEVIPSFREIDPMAYDELQAVIDRVTPVPDDEGGEL